MMALLVNGERDQKRGHLKEREKKKRRRKEKVGKKQKRKIKSQKKNRQTRNWEAKRKSVKSSMELEWMERHDDESAGRGWNSGMLIVRFDVKCCPIKMKIDRWIMAVLYSLHTQSTHFISYSHVPYLALLCTLLPRLDLYNLHTECTRVLRAQPVTDGPAFLPPGGCSGSDRLSLLALGKRTLAVPCR